MGTPTPTPPPPGSSTVTKVLLFLAFVLSVVAGLSLPFHWGPTVTENAGLLAIVLTASGGGWHVFFDTG